MKPSSALWRLVVAAALATALLTLVFNVIRQPVRSAVNHYSADFTDVSGLRAGADVRVRGVRVGKVESIDLVHRDGRSIADVGFTLDAGYSVVAQTRLAVKYQALTGLRYVDVRGPGTASQPAVRRIPTSMTEPSFDITRLFNGLQPVLSTLSPADVNTFSTNVDVFLSGDGSGLGPVLESINTLTRFLANRQQVISILLSNLKDVAATMSGHSRDVFQILEWVNRPLDAALDVLDDFRKSQIYGPEFTRVAVQLLNNAGFKRGIDIDAALDKAITDVDDTMDAFKLVPAIWDNIPPPGQAGIPLSCSRGRAELPLPVDVLLNGQKVLVCKQ